MIIIKDGILDRIKNWQEDSIYILIDFDRTITASGSTSSWGTISRSETAPKEYIEDRLSLHNKYRPIELDYSLDYDTKSMLMNEWWDKHINLLIKYKFSEEQISTILNDPDIMTFRNGAPEFLRNMKDKNIPVIIMSAGIGNLIEQFLKIHNCYFDNIFIISNFIKFENGLASGMCSNVIHTLNKSELFLPDKIKEQIKRRKHAIVIGDMLTDIQMVREEARADALKIGFLDENIEENKTYYEEQFDIVCINDVSFDEVLDELPILK